MTAPYQPFNKQVNVAGPTITPKTANNNGGGNAQPPYLQARVPTGGAQFPNLPRPTQPAITPMSTTVPGEVAPKTMGQTMSSPGQLTPGFGTGGQSQGWMGMAGSAMNQQPKITPQQPAPGGATVPPPGGQPPAPGQGPTPPQAGGNDLSGLYNFFASDLQNQAKQATANSVADASSRGVYYGTPLTGSEADINTQYLRGLGQLQAGMYGNEQQNQLARLGLATNLAGMSMMNGPPGGAIDPSVYQTIGQMFGNNNAASGARTGPQVTPATQPNQGVGAGGTRKANTGNQLGPV